MYFKARVWNTAFGVIAYRKCHTKTLIVASVCFITIGILFATNYERPIWDSVSSGGRILIHADSRRDFQQNDLSETVERELKNLDVGDDIFSSLVAILRKMRSRWLYGRVTTRRKYFDDEYIDLSTQVRRILRRTESQRWSRLNELSKAIRERIVKIQNPPDCNVAKLLVCDVTNLATGFGSKMHLMTIDFLRSIYSNRTFVLKSRGWKYEEENWEYYLRPLGKCEYQNIPDNLQMLSDKTQNERVVRSNFKTHHTDWSVPENILDALKKLHDDPFAWWIAQFVSYVFRLQPWFEAKVESIGDRIGFTNNVVGIHIRWGDKLRRDATKHEVNEYMDFANIFYQLREALGHKAKRVVYVATESSEAWKDLKSRYPEYTFIGSGYVNESRDISTTERMPYDGIKFALPSVLIDMYFLSKSDYVVCTLSSNICRATYELLMTRYVMASDRLMSLDHYYRFSSHPRYVVIQAHKKRNKEEIDMEVGDELAGLRGITYKAFDGSLFATNERTDEKGFFPPHKAKVIVKPLESLVFEDI